MLPLLHCEWTKVVQRRLYVCMVRVSLSSVGVPLKTSV